MLISSYTNDRRERSRGAVMVEFAIVTPLLILLVFGITEIGRALYQQNILTHQVETGARFMARVNGLLNDDCTTKATWSSNANAAARLVVYGSEDGDAASGDEPVVPNLDLAHVSITVSASDPIYVEAIDDTITACVINVHAEALFAGVFGPGYTIPPVPFLGLGTSSGWGNLGSLTLNADSQERYIGE